MAISSFELRLSSKFQCPTPQSAAPLEKRDRLLGNIHDVRAPHCEVVVKMGPQGSYAERINANFYQGHVPDAPMMIGAEQSKAYADGIASLGWGRGKIKAVVLAAAVGALIGVAAGGSFLAVYAAMGAMSAYSIAAPLTAAAAFYVVAFFSALGAATFGVYEATDWANAKLDLLALQEMSELGKKAMAGAVLPATKRRIEVLVRSGLGDRRWLIQQAALELEGLARQNDEKAAPELAA